ncbi:MAG: tRNA adenosine(34) deaminase TadA [Pseudomonadales bacterium]|tara:strand:+ start:6574 stop:7020 length:447 start_codon:yes stop_codon:yes gene_type:complete
MPEKWMQVALGLAAKAAQQDEVPVGAVVVRDNQIVGRGFNQPIGRHDPTAHAEIMALRDAASALGNYRLPGCTLVVTVEPCTMCAGALVHARIEQLIFGAREPRAGAVCSSAQVLDNQGLNHKVTVVEGVLEKECKALMSAFFKERRK